ncbi:MAG: FadR family transcriptional regulator [Clostridiales bacterium]|jgi:GntR family transcriptional repressor for pyruvate dehydrogenase complex|nr:FadR family transcriptional regulator [Clostridiales bacterium]
MFQNVLEKTTKRPTVVNGIIDLVFNALLQKKIKPGDMLPSENELSRQLGVGKSSVREAIKMLSAIGIVESIQGEGTYIRTSIDESAVNPLIYQMVFMQETNDNIFELRYIFEPAYVQLAMEKATAEDIELIQEAAKILEDKVRTNEQTAKDDIAFHEAILNATHNPLVIRIGRTILQLFEASIQKSMMSIPEQAVSDHKSILEAFKSKDSSLLHNAVIKSFEGWKRMLNKE